MISHRNVVVSMVQAAVAAEFEGPNPTLEVCIDVFDGACITLTVVHTDHPAGISWLFANIPYVRPALCVHSACVDGYPDSYHSEVEC